MRPRSVPTRQEQLPLTATSSLQSLKVFLQQLTTSELAIVAIYCHSRPATRQLKLKNMIRFTCRCTRTFIKYTCKDTAPITQWTWAMSVTYLRQPEIWASKNNIALNRHSYIRYSDNQFDKVIIYNIPDFKINFNVLYPLITNFILWNLFTAHFYIPMWFNYCRA